ncbi:unnamed protein product [Linum trigynum]|uniref:Uncharacterized protein n=1 Tax=Linum trigynum TaxID=586398 RepID=A0AAV2EQC6_9ROSI
MAGRGGFGSWRAEVGCRGDCTIENHFGMGDLANRGERIESQRRDSQVNGREQQMRWGISGNQLYLRRGWSNLGQYDSWLVACANRCGGGCEEGRRPGNLEKLSGVQDTVSNQWLLTCQ